MFYTMYPELICGFLFQDVVVSISNENPAFVTCVDDERLEFQDGQLVTFSEIKGMDGLNGVQAGTLYSYAYICDRLIIQSEAIMGQYRFRLYVQGYQGVKYSKLELSTVFGVGIPGGKLCRFALRPNTGCRRQRDAP